MKYDNKMEMCFFWYFSDTRHVYVGFWCKELFSL